MSDTTCDQGSRLPKVALTFGLQHVYGPASLQQPWKLAEEATREFIVVSRAGPQVVTSPLQPLYHVLCSPLRSLARPGSHKGFGEPHSTTQRPLPQISCPHEVTSYSLRPVFSQTDTPCETGAALLALPTGFSPVSPVGGGCVDSRVASVREEITF